MTMKIQTSALKPGNERAVFPWAEPLKNVNAIQRSYGFKYHKIIDHVTLTLMLVIVSGLTLFKLARGPSSRGNACSSPCVNVM